MSNMITFRNAITDARQEVEVSTGQTVRQAVESSGFIAPGSQFSVRDKNGQVVDTEAAVDHANTVLSVGLAGERVVGGGRGTGVTLSRVRNA
jgi:hypothetical protein